MKEMHRIIALHHAIAIEFRARCASLLPLCVKLPRRRNAGLLFYSDASDAKRQIGDSLATGTVKWFNPTKGYGFIQPTGGGKDVFVHISAVERAGLSTLNEGQVVEYQEASNRGKTSAENLKVQR
jgi:cold shock protein